ncbi:hypothetical protein QBC35DRAFT_93463 [Podospora australis]|uniref:Trichothecene 3-O-acetyltransferase-like N-terminal domain-containing protein n=1 Tax=Podospora australis TaxID=1536484 RepID=A0AAN6WY79_9PEZI|nr:hypothetical protein QBC35DRAFT_93463 [Podospora australis]
MTKQDVFHIQPLNWESDPEEERFPLRTLDYVSPPTYNNYALFFRLNDEDKPTAVTALREGLARLFTQARHLVGNIEPAPEEDPFTYHFVRRKGDTVPFHVQWLEEDPEAPSMDEIAQKHFTSLSLGSDLKKWSVPSMTYGEKPEAYPDAKPRTSSFKVNFVRGGMVLHTHHHHYANDVMGWAGYVRQLAENCVAILRPDSPPPALNWDVAQCLVSHRLTGKKTPFSQKLDGPPNPDRHPQHTKGISLLFHLPKSKAAALKNLASPAEGWISTYDAFSAFFFRTVTRLRAPYFPDLYPSPSSPVFWAEGVDIRRRLPSQLHERSQGNGMTAVMSSMAPGVTQPTLAEIVSEWPLPRLAQYVRQMTSLFSEGYLQAVLDQIESIKDKTSLALRTDSFPPASVAMTDHREAKMGGVDFGFGKAICYRHLLDRVTNGVVVVYPPNDYGKEKGDEEGVELEVFYEERFMRELVEDEEFGRYFEFRGVDAVDVTE